MTFRPFLVPVLACAVLAACASKEEQLRTQLHAANYCETVDDCTLIGSKCPFDCYIYVHKDEAERMKNAVDAFPSTCQYSCIEVGIVECLNHKCMPKVLDPRGMDKQPQVGTGEPCAADIDCATPMDYLTRSSCPFASRCLQGKCAVTCPMAKTQAPDQCANDSDCNCKDYAASDMKKCVCAGGHCAAVVAD
jgi:hypothetical protein